MTDATEAQVLQAEAWATPPAGKVTASETNGTVTITNTARRQRPVTVPTGTTVNGAAFGQAYGGELSDWVTSPGPPRPHRARGADDHQRRLGDLDRGHRVQLHHHHHRRTRPRP